MSGDERHTIDELRAKYDLEPSLRDVYVEGGLDAAVVEWVLRENGCRNAAVYEIETVDVPVEVLARHGLDDGEKGRVIGLCLELQGHLQSDNQVTGIVDRDYDHLVGKTYACPLLLFTDYTCMEMYFFDETVITKFLHFVLRRPDQSTSALLMRLQAVLQEIFVIRSANQALGLGLKWLEVKGQCKVTTSQMQFNRTEFISKYLNKNAKLSEVPRFTETVDSFRPRLHTDPATKCTATTSSSYWECTCIASRRTRT
ncbi:MAG: DUF4435 domain-containing protein [Gemmataceae bacterium]|nr:DUF4435 domain-containing protein [Gemmataceae bacterium]